MDNNSVFRNRAYLVNDTKLSTGFETEVLRRIVALMGKRLASAELSDSTPDYDSYRIEAGGRFLNVKLSFDETSAPILYENKILPTIPLSIGPRFLHSDSLTVGDNSLLFLLSTLDNVPTIADLGRSVLLEQDGRLALSHLLRALQSCERGEARSLKEFMSYIFEFVDIQSYFFDDSLESLDEYSDLEKINNLFQQIKSEIIGTFDLELMTGSDILCHGNFGMDNIVCRSQHCKLRNFEYAFTGSQWFDVAHLVFDMGISGPVERALIKDLEPCINEGGYHEYKQIKDFYAKIYLLRLAVAYLTEVYIFSSSRPSKIITLNTKFVQNFPAFHVVETFRENKDYISKLITEPILGFKA